MSDTIDSRNQVQTEGLDIDEISLDEFDRIIEDSRPHAYSEIDTHTKE
jgi:hypothetical protein